MDRHFSAGENAASRRRDAQRRPGKAVQTPELIAAQAKFSNEMMFQMPAQFAETVKTTIDKWKPIVAASGFVPGDWRRCRSD